MVFFFFVWKGFARVWLVSGCAVFIGAQVMGFRFIGKRGGRGSLLKLGGGMGGRCGEVAGLGLGLGLVVRMDLGFYPRGPFSISPQKSHAYLFFVFGSGPAIPRDKLEAVRIEKKDPQYLVENKKRDHPALSTTHANPRSIRRGIRHAGSREAEMGGNCYYWYFSVRVLLEKRCRGRCCGDYGSCIGYGPRVV